MIMKFLKKIPAGMMVVPMLLGAFINTFFPQVTGIGSFTTAIFTSAGANAAIGIQLFCLGTTLRFREIGGVVKRGGVLLIAKFIIGAAIGIHDVAFPEKRAIEHKQRLALQHDPILVFRLELQIIDLRSVLSAHILILSSLLAQGTYGKCRMRPPYVASVPHF